MRPAIASWPRIPGAELAPRDVVARAVWRHMAAGHKVFLDARDVPDLDFPRRFPAITGFCHAAGIDPVTRTHSGSPGGALSHGRHCGRSQRAGRRSRAYGPVARRPARASTAPIASPAIRFSRRRFAAACCREHQSGPRRPPPQAAWPRCGRIRPIRLAVRKILSGAAGVLRDGEGLAAAAAELLPLALGERASERSGPRRT